MPTRSRWRGESGAEGGRRRRRRRTEGNKVLDIAVSSLPSYSAESFSLCLHLNHDQGKNVFQKYFHSRYNTRATGEIMRL
jgi:hypothetical protein